MVSRRSAARVAARAQQAEKEGRFGEALAMAKAVLADQPSCIEARLIVARVLARSGDFAGAKRTIEPILFTSPECVEARMIYAGIMLLTGRYDVAVDHLATAAGQCEAEGAGDSVGYSHHQMAPGLFAAGAFKDEAILPWPAGVERNPRGIQNIGGTGGAMGRRRIGRRL